MDSAAPDSPQSSTPPQLGPLVAPKRQLLSELGALTELASVPKLLFASRSLPRGDQRVYVFPGFLTGDESTFMIRRVLSRLGHDVRGWGIGLNRGHVEELIPALVHRMEKLTRDKPVAIIGWSLGGYLAREVARELPERVTQVFTMGSPVIGGPKYTGAATLYANERGVDLDDWERQIAARDDVPLRVPVTAFYSLKDKVVCPAATIDHVNANVEHIEVRCAHAGFGFNAFVLGEIARRLAR